VTVYHPGDRVSMSGIYKALHNSGHVPPHNVTCTSGKAFPPCGICGTHIEFTLVKAAHHIDNHELFGADTRPPVQDKVGFWNKVVNSL